MPTPWARAYWPIRSCVVTSSSIGQCAALEVLQRFLNMAPVHSRQSVSPFHKKPATSIVLMYILAPCLLVFDVVTNPVRKRPRCFPGPVPGVDTQCRVAHHDIRGCTCAHVLYVVQKRTVHGRFLSHREHTHATTWCGSLVVAPVVGIPHRYKQCGIVKQGDPRSPRSGDPVVVGLLHDFVNGGHVKTP